MIVRLNQAGPQALRSEVCIVGAGPAGIVLALELARQKRSVILLESGTLAHDARTQALGDAVISDAQRHAAMHLATHRKLGGASALWGGRCVPLDAIDLAPRDYVADAAWPIAFDELAKYYPAACEYAGCGRADFSSRSALPGRQPSIVPALPDGMVLSSTLERWASPTDFGQRYRTDLERSPHITLVLGATCTSIQFEQSRSVTSALIARALSGGQVRVQADTYVLAAGGLETTRLLLNSDTVHAGGVGNHSGKLGRYYMGHISGKIAEVVFSTPQQKTISGFERDHSGVYCRKRFTLSAEAQRQHALLNCAFWLDNPRINDAAHGNGILSFAYLALTAPVLSRRLAPEAIRAAAVGGGGAAWPHLRNVVLDFPAVASFVPSFGYRRYVAKRRIPGFFLHSRNNIYALHYHAEQAPDGASRVYLSDKTDALGMRRLQIDLRFSNQDVDSVIRSHALLDAYLREHRSGKIAYKSNSYEDSVRAQASDGFHQLGTARMAARADHGVVDADCKIHGVDNLYVCSSAVFPTSGQANPTLTIMALAVRLAAHLRARTNLRIAA
jgi:choline dehydrogenase-like flavoprotein